MNRVLHRVTTTLLAALLAWPGIGAAQSFPSRAIRIIVPYSPGGSTDVVFRLLAPRLSEELGQPVVVENRPGASSTIGLDLAAKSPPDGHTWGVANIAYGANPSLIRKMPFNSKKDLVPVSQVTIVTMVLSLHPSVPARSVKQLVALAKRRPEEINFGSAGYGSANHLATARFMHLTGTKLVHVPYKGGGPAVVSLVSGETSMLFATIPSAIHHIQAGRLRALAVSRAARSSALPDIPTVAEAGVPGYEAIEWNGVMVPAGTSQAVIQRIHESLSRVLAVPDVKERIVGMGAEAVGSNPAEFSAFIRNELTVWAKVVRGLGITVE
ncbi:MAG: tripartite tricarboxylate transporter substrate binding protein [Betaproteobacteria bacterium]|nr:tripartite tricarboxylate transporter substrate binding protein [Betaproteobacteria bacterium]